MIVSPGEAAAAGALLLLACVLPGFLFTLGVFPRMPLTERVAVGGAVGLALPALAETLLGQYAGVRLTRELALFLTFLVGFTGILALPRWQAWREWFRPWSGTTRRTIVAVGLLLLLAVVLNVKPHVDYSLPIHRDEWVHYDAAVAIERAGGTVEGHKTWAGFTRNPELGFHVLLLHAKLATGVSWEALLLAWPTLVFVLTLVALYAVTAPAGYGVESVLMGLALPTSVRVLGPQYAVPLALGLFLIPVAYSLFLRPERARAWTLLATVMAFTYLAHPPSAIAVAFLMLGYSAVSIRKHWRMGLALLPLAALPFVLAKLEAPKSQVSADRILEAQITLPVPTFLELFGVVPILLFLAGTYVALRSLRPERLGWLATSLAHLGIILVYLQFNAGVNILYDRAWMHGLLTMSVTAASGLAALRGAVAARVDPEAAWARPALATALALVVLLPASTAQHAREGDNYRFVTEDEYEDFRWIRDHVTPWNGSKAALEAHKGTAFRAVTGIEPLSDSWSDTPPRWLQKFLEEGCRDQKFIEAHSVGLVYWQGEVLNTDLVALRPRVYVPEP